MYDSRFAATQDLPEYKQLRKVFSQRILPLTIVCGAGLSRSAKLPSWTKLRTIIHNSAQAKVRSLNQLGQSIYDAKLSTANTTADFWVAFELYEEILTRPTFRNIIVENLTPNPNAGVPRGYAELLRLNPRGLVTLNLDKFAAEAFASTHSQKIIAPVYGLELASKWHILRDAPQYVVYLHGEVTDLTNWVLTKSQLDRLLSSGAHSHFLHSLYADHIVVFAGVSADDIALSSRLLQMRSEGFKPPALYWLTTRLDTPTLQWADENYISVIGYQANDDGEHEEFFSKLSADFISYLPEDDPAPPPIASVRSRLTPLDAPADPKALAQLSPEEIRLALSHALDLLIDTAPKDRLYLKFQEFCKKYKFPISRAFYKDDEPDFSTWFGYELLFPSLGRGNFGEVMLSNDKDGNQVALKLMHYTILDDNNMLGGFRRGIRSMRFLTEAGIKGVVRLIDSYELPPTIVMEYVTGVTLPDAINARPNTPWTIKINILYKVASIVYASHSLAMTILHRDLKPSNIMISNFDYLGWFDPDLVVLDFDMSWHKGSSEKDVVFESRDDFGYLSPEQTSSIRGVSTISTRVDSYGLGMTAYFLFGCKHPRPNEGLSENWYQTALRATRRDYKESWRSAPARLARVIQESTTIAQADRMDFSTAFREIQTLLSAISDPSSLTNPEFWAEEILANLPSPAEYIWRSEYPLGEIRLERGLLVKCRPDFRRSSVNLTYEFQFQGGQQYTRLTQKIDSITPQLKKPLEDAGWTWESFNRGPYQAQLSTSIEVGSLISRQNAAFGAASDAFKLFEAIVLS